ncbi:permease-like cell division protein FtsX [Desertivibrio insolitus]|uniref:permease-like cell division protein FtsX n=1 Tax=Herbiconiux sp. SYSU D00978 TaxID=2812562 RepID=UPI001A95DCCA|nr:permease-like cell division protein FtsX [Herbiconiux sp. SYSU D00978]
MRWSLIWREVGQGLARNLSMVVSVVLVTFISLTFVGAAILLQFQVNQMKGFWYDRAEVAVYLCSPVSLGTCNQAEASQEQKDAVQAQLQSETLAPYVESFEFENHDQAYTRFQEQFEGNAVADLVTPDLLSEAFWVKLADPDDAELLHDSLSSLAGVESVVDQRSYLDQIFSVLNAASITAVAIAVLMLVAAVLLIATTIRLSAFSRRRELSIMRLVGASNRFIQTPFVLEGVLAALLGSVLAGAAIVGIVYFFVQGYLSSTLTTISFISVDDALIVVPILLGIGALLAAASANVAISRYLRV